MNEDTRIVLAKFRKTFGIKGEIHLELYTCDNTNLLNYPELYIDETDEKITLSDLRQHGDHFVARIENCKDCDEAQLYVGKNITVDRKSLPELPEGEFYWTDLKGMNVYNKDGEKIGSISHLFSAGDLQMMSIVNDSVETIIPFKHGETVDKVELAEKAIYLLITP